MSGSPLNLGFEVPDADGKALSFSCKAQSSLLQYRGCQIAAAIRTELVSSEPGARKFLSKPSSGPRREDTNPEVQHSADNEYLDRERHQPESQTNDAAEQVEHHAYGKEAQHGKKADHEDGA